MRGMQQVAFKELSVRNAVNRLVNNPGRGLLYRLAVREGLRTGAGGPSNKREYYEALCNSHGNVNLFSSN